MPLNPKLKRILLPPSIPPSSILGSIKSSDTVVDIASTLLAAQIDLNTASAKTSTPENVIPTPPLQRHVSLHPSKPLVAYVLNPVDVGIATNTNKVVVVQNVVTKEIIMSMSWIDLAAVLYGEADVKKLPAAAKSLGVIQSIQFYDPAVVFWSRLMTTTTATTSSDRFEALAIQTDKRVILLNLRKGPNGTQVFQNTPFQLPQNSPSSTTIHKSPYRVILAHLCEKTIGAMPSSNILPLTDRWLLLGCVDGSMKCYDWTTGSTVKKIKGLGKVDSIVKILSANRLHSDLTSLSAQTGSAGLRRILTVSKKGIVYLIEIEIDVEKNSIDIQPPLGRFYIGSPVEVPAVDSISLPEAATSKDLSPEPTGPIMEHCIISYDAHMDRLLWLTPRSKQSQTLSVWNLRALQHDFIQQANLANSSGSSSKNLFKPDPSLVIQFPTTTSAATAATVAVITHPAFPADTIVCITVTNTGEFFMHGAKGLDSNTTQTIFSTPVNGMSLTDLLVNAVPALAEENERHSSSDTSIVRVHAALSQPLPSSGSSDVIIATNTGLFILDLPSLTNQGTHVCHFGAGLGILSKSVLMAQHSNIEFAAVDSLTGNPIGYIEPKNPITVYESPIATNMPQEFQKRPFRNPPTFFTSPSGIYVCLFWPAEFRYEILHIPSVMQKIGQRTGVSIGGADPVTTPTRNPVVASGSGVADFAWIGDDDLFCILHAADLMEQAAKFVPQKDDVEGGSFLTPNFKQLGASAFNVASLATSATKSATSGAISATKLATSATVSATMSVTKGATTAANKTVGAAKESVRVGAKVMKKSFKMFGVGKKKKGGAENETGTSITADDDEDESESGGVNAMNVPSAADIAALEYSMKNLPRIDESRQRYVELHRLEALENVGELSGTSPAAQRVNLGEIALRGGKRNLPTALFGGPVLCVASRIGDSKEGQAHFYTRKKNEADDKASAYSSSGPTLPCPDLVAWDDDGSLCAIVVENRIAVYLSSEPDFVLLGSVRISSPSVPVVEVTNIRFVHGALFCCTWNSVHCVLLGDLDEGGLCKLDTYLLASTDVPNIPQKVVHDDRSAPFVHNPVCLPLIQPNVLGYQSGSLLVSTIRGVLAVPLNSPLLRIGLLLAEGQTDRASKWFEAVPNIEHEALAAFLERRGCPEMAIQLSGLSLQTVIDMSMRFGYVDRLEEVVETFGVGGLRSIDMGRGVSPSIFGPELTANSVVVCVGAYLLGHGRVELTRRLATECLRSGEEGKKDAFFLGTLLLPIDEADAGRLITRAVEEGGAMDDWLIGKFVRDHLLSTSTTRRT